MSQTVFILGAGASKATGAPLMWEFLDAAEDIAVGGTLDTTNQAAFDSVFKAIAGLRVAQSKARIDLGNVEAVFAAFEMADLLGIPLEGLASPDKLVSAMRRLISTTLEQRIAYPIKRHTSGSRVQPHTQYSQLAECVGNLNKAARGSVSVISFNYDLAFDRALGWHNVPFSYCLDAPGRNDVPFLKLHGSLNWAQCVECRNVEVVTMEKVFELNQIDVEMEIEAGAEKVVMPISNYVFNRPHCGSTTEAGVVPPIWNKTQYHRELKAVWQRAAKELGTAENVVVIGYSIPDTDQFFRYLYSLASTSDTRLKRFVVVDPDGKVEDRFRSILGQAAESRFEFLRGTWEGVATWIVSENWQRKQV